MGWNWLEWGGDGMEWGGDGMELVGDGMRMGKITGMGVGRALPCS